MIKLKLKNLKRLLPDNPNELNTDYIFSDYDIQWVKDKVINRTAAIWTTSAAIYLICEEEKAVALAAYTTSVQNPEDVLEEIKRTKVILTEKLDWNFGYDASLNETIKLKYDVDKMRYIGEKLNRLSKKIGFNGNFIDVDEMVDSASMFWGVKRR